MLTEKAVLILGAGASACYGFPTAVSLLRFLLNGRISPNVCPEDIAREDRTTVLKNYLIKEFGEDRLQDFKRALAASARDSIDSFLAKNLAYAEIGKTAIAIAILEYEAYWNDLVTRPDLDWYRYLFNGIFPETDSLQTFGENLSIITFNYDRSFERYITAHLPAASGEPYEKCVAVFRKIPIIHVYGQAGQIPMLNGEPGVPWGQPVKKTSVEQAAAAITVIHEGQSKDETVDAIREQIRAATTMCFLGFGFHSSNVQLLGLDPNDKRIPAKVFFSTYGMKANEIRRARRCFGNSPELKPDIGILELLRTHDVLPLQPLYANSGVSHG